VPGSTRWSGTKKGDPSEPALVLLPASPGGFLTVTSDAAVLGCAWVAPRAAPCHSPHTDDPQDSVSTYAPRQRLHVPRLGLDGGGPRRPRARPEAKAPRRERGQALQFEGVTAREGSRRSRRLWDVRLAAAYPSPWLEAEGPLPSHGQTERNRVTSCLPTIRSLPVCLR
jgi:hypothetical protein